MFLTKNFIIKCIYVDEFKIRHYFLNIYIELFKCFESSEIIIFYFVKSNDKSFKV